MGKHSLDTHDLTRIIKYVGLNPKNPQKGTRVRERCVYKYEWQPCDLFYRMYEHE